MAPAVTAAATANIDISFLITILLFVSDRVHSRIGGTIAAGILTAPTRKVPAMTGKFLEI
jgi:hypothetical protein